ncbi:MAG: hypothetical protein HY904_15445 [Deltaproteobacteria bacterium]|nr:hypothetical protein [Deltaproteobacteria bacterium]
MEPTLNDTALSTLLSLHDAGELKRADRLTEPGARARWRLTTTSGAYLLTLVEDRPFWDLVHEKDLVLFLAAQRDALGGLEVPDPLPNVARGYFFPIETRYAWLMRFPRGRQLGVFELDAEACRQVGAALGRLHRVARRFRGHRRHSARPAVLREWLRAARGAPGEDVQQAVAEAHAELAWLRRPLGRLLPRGTLHGAPGLPAFRFHHGVLCHVGELGESSSGPLVADVGAALCHWGFTADGADAHRCGALLAAYDAQRALSPAERGALYAYARLGALRLLVGHLRDYELRQRADEPQGYRAFTPFLALLRVLRGMGRAGFRALWPDGWRR